MSSNSKKSKKTVKNVLPDLIIPCLALIFTIYYLTTITEAPWIAQASAIVVGSLLLLLIGFFFIKTFFMVRNGIEDISFSNKAIERLTCQYNGEDLEIGFNGRFLSELISAVESEAVKIEISTPSKAVNIFPSEQKEGENILMLIMPIMLSEN